MTSKPQFPPGYSDGEQNGALLFGIEYQNTGSLDKNHDKDAACVVCQHKTASQVYTQGGRSNSCSNGHSTVYTGYVMSSYYCQHKQDWVCVDKDRAYHKTSINADQNGGMWYTTEMEGGSTDEVLYPHDREVGCAVCGVQIDDSAEATTILDSGNGLAMG